jgi:hypothetical protein
LKFKVGFVLDAMHAHMDMLEQSLKAQGLAGFSLFGWVLVAE